MRIGSVLNTFAAPPKTEETKDTKSQPTSLISKIFEVFSKVLKFLFCCGCFSGESSKKPQTPPKPLTPEKKNLFYGFPSKLHLKPLNMADFKDNPQKIADEMVATFKSEANTPSDSTWWTMDGLEQPSQDKILRKIRMCGANLFPILKDTHSLNEKVEWGIIRVSENRFTACYHSSDNKGFSSSASMHYKIEVPRHSVNLDLYKELKSSLIKKPTDLTAEIKTRLVEEFNKEGHAWKFNLLDDDTVANQKLDKVASFIATSVLAECKDAPEAMLKIERTSDDKIKYSISPGNNTSQDTTIDINVLPDGGE